MINKRKNNNDGDGYDNDDVDYYKFLLYFGF